MSVKAQMEKILQDHFTPTEMTLIDQSDQHIGHAGHDGRGESHFKLKMTSSHFIGTSRVERQRMVYSVLDPFLKSRVHAISLHLDVPKEIN